MLRKIFSPVSSTASVLSTAGSSLGLPNFGYVFSGLGKSVDAILGGVYANGWLVFLGFVGLLVLLRLKSSVSRFFVAWTFVGCMSRRTSLVSAAAGVASAAATTAASADPMTALSKVADFIDESPCNPDAFIQALADMLDELPQACDSSSQALTAITAGSV